MFVTKYKKSNKYYAMGMYLLRRGFTGSGLYYTERSIIIKGQARKEEKQMLKAIFG